MNTAAASQRSTLSAASAERLIKRRQMAAYGGGLFAAILLWYILTSANASLNAFGPGGTLRAMPRLLTSSQFWEGLRQSTERLLVGLSLAALIGIPLGIAIGYFRWCGEATYVPFQVLRMISPLSWAPVAIIVFGVGSTPVYFLVTIAAVWPVILNTAAGVRAAEPSWLDAARSLGAGDSEVIRFVIIRAALPSILTGLQLALGVAWIVLVPAEMLGVASGLGYLILDFRDVNDYSSIMALILVIGGLGLLLDWPFRLAVRRAQWH